MAGYKVGERLRSRVSKVQVVVVRAADNELEICCGGETLAREGENTSPAQGDSAEVPKILIGKRYEDEAATVELLCVAPGDGELTIGGKPLRLKAPKPLPASD